MLFVVNKNICTRLDDTYSTVEVGGGVFPAISSFAFNYDKVEKPCSHSHVDGNTKTFWMAFLDEAG